MKVTLLAATTYYGGVESVKDTDWGKYDLHSYSMSEADRLAHFAGRSCYQSWNMPNPDTSTDMGYMANIINQGHFSVLEHASATFYVEGVSRNMTHELIRHRHLSYSELSQRYINMEDAYIMVPPAIDVFEGKDWADAVGSLGRTMDEVTDRYERLVKLFEKNGIKGKKAREAARALLPGGTETKIVVTGNHRAWRDMLHKRYSVHADAEIRLFATEILKELRKIAPATYQDFPDEPFA